MILVEKYHQNGKPVGGVVHCIKCSSPQQEDAFGGKEFIIVTFNSIFVASSYKTVAHELGHYLNLPHPFSGTIYDNTDLCLDGDGIADTPPAGKALWHKKTDGSIIDSPCENAPVCQGHRRQIENLMDYGPCSWMFTKGQAEVMVDMLKNNRPTIYTPLYSDNENCNPVGDVIVTVNDLRTNLISGVSRNNPTEVFASNNIEEKDKRLIIYPNPVKDQLKIACWVDKPGKADFKVYDAVGKLIHRESTFLNQGRQEIKLKAFNAGNFPVGTYLLSINTNEWASRKKIIIIK